MEEEYRSYGTGNKGQEQWREKKGRIKIGGGL
jgi:hypothetical protein